MPRCFTIVCVADSGNEEALKIVGMVKGMPKFTGKFPAFVRGNVSAGLNTDEEDESESPNQRTTQHMCNRDQIKKATHFLVTTKANGKSVVLTAFDYLGHTYFILGSKNVHEVVPADVNLKVTT